MSGNNSSGRVWQCDGTLMRRLHAILVEPLKSTGRLSSAAWRMLRSCSPLYAGLIIMAAYAVWDARTPVTMIAPFQLPKADLPFSGDIVADALQDALKSIHNEIEGESQDPGLQSSETGLPDLRNMLIPKFRRVQAPPRFTVEVKGLSYERILSVARGVMNSLAKGNLPQQNASRTPSREDASSALERVRQAASKDKKLRFTALLNHIYNLETLRMAYLSLKKEAAPGVDGETEKDPKLRCQTATEMRAD